MDWHILFFASELTSAKRSHLSPTVLSHRKTKLQNSAARTLSFELSWAHKAALFHSAKNSEETFKIDGWKQESADSELIRVRN
jgi:hypothetical protein